MKLDICRTESGQNYLPDDRQTSASQNHRGQSEIPNRDLVRIYAGVREILAVGRMVGEDEQTAPVEFSRPLTS